MTSPDIMNRDPIPELPPASVRRKLRRKFGVTQEELARTLGVSRQTIVAWERTKGGNEPTGYKRVEYARILTAWETRGNVVSNEGSK